MKHYSRKELASQRIPFERHIAQNHKFKDAETQLKDFLHTPLMGLFQGWPRSKILRGQLEKKFDLSRKRGSVGAKP